MPNKTVYSNQRRAQNFGGEKGRCHCPRTSYSGAGGYGYGDSLGTLDAGGAKTAEWGLVLELSGVCTWYKMAARSWRETEWRHSTLEGRKPLDGVWCRSTGWLDLPR